MTTIALRQPPVRPDDAPVNGRIASAASRDRTAAVSVDGSAVSPLGFDALLRATQAMVGAVNAGYQRSASAAQVFEADPEGPNDSNEHPLERQARAKSGRFAQRGPADATGVEARCSEASQPNSPDVRSSRNAGIGTPSSGRVWDGHDQAVWRSKSGDELPAGPREVERQGGRHSPEIRGVAGPLTVVDPSGRAAARSVPVSSVNATAATTGSQQSAARPNTVSPAQQVAQILGAGRGAGAETAGAAPGGEGPAGRRPGGDAPRSQAMPDRNGSVAGESRQTSDTSRAEDVERTPFDRLVRSIRLNRGAKHSSARMQLDPPELGRLDVDVRVLGDRVRIEVRAQTADAGRLVHEQAGRLTAALRQHGIDVEHLAVSVDGGDNTPDGTLADGEADTRPDGDGRAAHAVIGRRGVPGPNGTVTGIQDGSAERDSMVVSETRLDIRV